MGQPVSLSWSVFVYFQASIGARGIQLFIWIFKKNVYLNIFFYKKQRRHEKIYITKKNFKYICKMYILANI